jgi:hypothetical protein
MTPPKIVAFAPKPSEEVIEMARRLLAAAEAGEIIGLGYVAETAPHLGGGHRYGTHFENVLMAAGAVARVQHIMQLSLDQNAQVWITEDE